MNNKVLAAIVAGGLLVGAGFMTSIVSAPGTATAQEDAEQPTEDGLLPRALGFLGDVLGGLVDDGTIDQDQANAILEATEVRAAEMKAERDSQRELLEGFLEDDVVTEDEASQLPDDHPLLSDRYDEAWEDSELTRDELRPNSRRGFFKRGFKFGSMLDDGGIDQSEYDALDDDHPLNQADVSEYLEDGLITPDELREIHHDLRGARSEGA